MIQLVGNCHSLISQHLSMGILGRMVVSVLPIMPKFIVGRVSRRYHAGEDLDSALDTMARLSEEGACFTIDVLGEEITSMEEVKFFTEEYDRVLDAIVSRKIDANLSIKPTAFGLLIDPKMAE
jgi:proline dehydrogenase